MVSTARYAELEALEQKKTLGQRSLSKHWLERVNAGWPCRIWPRPSGSRIWARTWQSETTGQ
jgi:hypothetical protein